MGIGVFVAAANMRPPLPPAAPSTTVGGAMSLWAWLYAATIFGSIAAIFLSLRARNYKRKNTAWLLYSVAAVSIALQYSAAAYDWPIFTYHLARMVQLLVLPIVPFCLIGRYQRPIAMIVSSIVLLVTGNVALTSISDVSSTGQSQYFSISNYGLLTSINNVLVVLLAGAGLADGIYAIYKQRDGYAVALASMLALTLGLFIATFVVKPIRNELNAGKYETVGDTFLVLRSRNTGSLYNEEKYDDIVLVESTVPNYLHPGDSAFFTVAVEPVYRAIGSPLEPRGS